ncbi:hypothetical protein LTR62_005827 [Meristemomyces frigidus]|uniref:Uncharacterized protein n=1 Tax=Meristemomyces frigidus TaxID=1508187 RepID=A0AAN7TF08_9PEZI|nr:hypothetical protein LTR62_005827 [Meristemomyces frigidus]
MALVHFVRKRGHRAQNGITHGRLLVGYRKRDYRRAWYEPDDIEREDDTVPEYEDRGKGILLFKCDSAHGGIDPDEPKLGEIDWLPHYDPASFASKVARERELMQRQFLWKAWQYCAASTEAKVLELEEKFHDPAYRRWDSWMEEARKGKKKAGKRKRKTREERREFVRAAGMNPDQVEINSDDSDDSGYEDDEEVLDRATPSPHRNRAGGEGSHSARRKNRKRKASVSGGDRPAPTAKKSRIDPFMNGAAGDTSRAGTPFSRQASPEVLGRKSAFDVDDEDNDNDSGNDDKSVGDNRPHSSTPHISPKPRTSAGSRAPSEMHTPRTSPGPHDDDGFAGDLVTGRPLPLAPNNDGGAAAALPTPSSTEPQAPRNKASAEVATGVLQPFSQWGQDQNHGKPPARHNQPPGSDSNDSLFTSPKLGPRDGGSASDLREDI